MGYDSMNIVEWFEQLLLFGLHVPLNKKFKFQIFLLST